MSSDAERRKYAENIAREWADKGKAIEGGWRSYRAYMLPADMQRMLEATRESSPEAMDALLRKVFFLGANHLWGVAFQVVGDGPETSDELQRMSNIQREMQAFVLEMSQQHKPGNA